jgi:hypothetical protein
MDRNHLQILVVVFCLLSVLRADSLAVEDAASEARAMEGLWSGAWGHRIDPDGVVHQPVLAQVLIKGDRIESHSFPDAPDLIGTIRVDSQAGQILITPTVEPSRPPAEAIVYGYEIKDDRLRLSDKGKRSIDLHRYALVHVPLANVAVEFVVATGINDAGDLLVTKFNRLRFGQAGGTFLEPQEEKLKTRQAKILLVEDAGVKAITVDDARRLIRGSTPVLITYQHEERPTGDPSPKSWKAAEEPAMRSCGPTRGCCGREHWALSSRHTRTFLYPEFRRKEEESGLCRLLATDYPRCKPIAANLGHTGIASATDISA